MKFLILFLALSFQGELEERDSTLKEGDVFIPREWRIRNRNGNCVWCTVEMVFWGAAGHEQFKGITERAIKEGWHGAEMENVLSAARQANIEVVFTRNRDYKVLYDSVKNGTGAYIQIPGHAITVVGIDEESVRIIDNNGTKEAQVWPRRKFDQYWQGTACYPKTVNIQTKPGLCPLKIRPRPNPDHPPLNPSVPPLNPSVPSLEQRLQEAEARHKKELQELEIRLRKEADQRKAEEDQRKAFEEARRKAEEESQRRALEESQRNLEEAKKKMEEEFQKKAEAQRLKEANRLEALRKAQEEALRKAQEEALRKAQEEANKLDEANRLEAKKQEEALRKSQEEAKRKKNTLAREVWNFGRKIR